MKKEETVKRCRKCGKPIAIIMSRPYRNYVVDAEAVVVAANAGGEMFIRQDGTKIQARELSTKEEFTYLCDRIHEKGTGLPAAQVRKMICKRCPEGRTYATGSTFCRFYGMIIRNDNECTLNRGKTHEQNGNYRLAGYDGPTIRENGGWFAGTVPDVLSESGERESIPGMEEAEEGGRI